MPPSGVRYRSQHQKSANGIPCGQASGGATATDVLANGRETRKAIHGRQTVNLGKILQVNAMPLLAAFGLSICGVWADYLLKKAGLHQSILNYYFAGGMTIYAFSAFGWLYVLRHLSFAQVGVVYSVSTVLLLTATGIIFFQEVLRPMEIIGIGCAVLSICLLNRFA